MHNSYITCCFVYMKSRDSSVTLSRPTLGPTQPPIQWVKGALSLG